MFTGRERELAKLEELYRSGKFEFVVVYGRRRVGKTALLSRFCEGKRAVFFSALEATAEENLKTFSQALFSCGQANTADAPVWPDFQSALQQAERMSQDERLILVIDEYPWLAASDSSISSRLQHLIDHKFSGTKLFLILCGSSMSFIEHQVLGYKSPLYGRRTAQMKILPFSCRETALFHPAWSAEENALVYGVTGGIPLYALAFDEKLSVDENIVRNFFNRDASLFEEPSNLLKQELREPQTYNAVIAAIARGATRLSEIASKTKLESSACAHRLASLSELGIVTRETPVTDPAGKRAVYQVSDLLFRFWHRFVPGAMTLIATDRGAEFYQLAVKPQLSTYMGPIFERICREFLLSRTDRLPFVPKDLGCWWGSDPRTRQQEEIDLLALSIDGDEALFGECKYTEELPGLDVLRTLQRRSALVHSIQKHHFAIFSRKGFTEELQRAAREESVALFTLEEMLNGGDAAPIKE